MRVSLFMILLPLLAAGVIMAYHFAGQDEAPNAPVSPESVASAVFAGGCFWCVEADFEKVEGVIDAVSGYAGGHRPDPTYEVVSSGKTGHVEAVRVFFNPEVVSYSELLEVFWKHVDPTDDGGQFVDRGRQYRTLIFYRDETQKTLAEESKKRLAQSRIFERPIVTEIKPLGRFYRAEDYHQDYYRKNPIRYKLYRFNSGRDGFLNQTWKGRDVDLLETTSDEKPETSYQRPPDPVLRAQLTELQYRVTREDATEPPFRNQYWNNKAEGIYVDVVSGEPLFSSTDKFDSGTGWPSFTRPLERGTVVEGADRGWLTVRTEVRSRHADSHLGHVFRDGPPPAGLRYCINSAALRFIARERLQEEGYGQYLQLWPH